MSSRDIFDDMKRAKEEEYFRKKEKELIEKMRQRAQLEAERQKMQQASGITDEDIIKDLQQLGYDHETIKLLHLVPLLQVAWSEGQITARERELILEAARSRGITEGSLAYARLSEWLSRRPQEEFFERTLRIIASLLESLPAQERESSRQDLLSYCLRIASASGGILGLGSISERERAALERIAAELGGRQAARRLLGKD